MESFKVRITTNQYVEINFVAINYATVDHILFFIVSKFRKVPEKESAMQK